MNATVNLAPGSLFRDREGAVINAITLLWVTTGWIGSFPLMGADTAPWNILGLMLCVHTMVLAAYLIHEAAHQAVFTSHAANTVIGEAMSFIAGSSYASFERIRHLHIRHHMERADVNCFDFVGLLRRNPVLCRTLEILEWCYLPAMEVLMHLQIVWRPVLSRSQRRYLPRSMAMLFLRGTLLALLALWSFKAFLLYFLAYAILLHVLNFFDAFHHKFEQIFVEADQPVPPHERSRAYEEEFTYSNVVSIKYPWLNLLILNFGYHNAHHQRASVPWYRLPRFHRSIYGDRGTALMPVSELLRSWHFNRVRRVRSDGSGPGVGAGRADAFVGAHGVSFLTVM